MNDESLHEVISDFLDSCHRNDQHDIDDNIKYFLKENNHMKLDKNEVNSIFYEIENE